MDGEPVTKASQLPAADAGTLPADAELLVRAAVSGRRKLARARIDQLPGVSQAVTSVAGRTGAVTLTKSDVGLGNVDNTADSAKPVSAAQQAALDAKANASALSAHTADTANPHAVTKAQVGLSNVDNTADASKPISAAQQAALDLKAPLASPAFSGTPTVPNVLAGDASTKAANTAFVAAAIAALINSSPGALDTLRELAAAIGDDPNFAATMTAALAGKAAKSANLSDLTDAAAARSNLGLGTAAQQASGFFALASHVHAASEITSGVIATSRLGTGTANSSSFLRGDGSWATVTVPTVASTSSVLKGDAAGNVVAATAGTDFAGISSTNAFTGSNSFARGIITTSDPLALTQTWNASGVTFRALDVNVTNTASAAASLLLDLRVGGASQMSVSKNGALTLIGNSAGYVGSGIILGPNTGYYSFADEDHRWSRGIGGSNRMRLASSILRLPNDGGFAVSSTNDAAGTPDVMLSRSSAGVAEINSGTIGSLRDFAVRKYFVGSSSGPTWSSGTGSPEGSITAPVGSLYSRTDGGANTSLYVKESGSGNTGWVAK